MAAPITLYNEDARLLRERLAPSSVDLAIFSPPYNVGIQYADAQGDGDHMEEVAYQILLSEVFSGLEAVLKTGGRVAVVVARGVDRRPWKWLSPKIGRLLYASGFDLRGTIIWDKMTTGGRTSWGSWRQPSNPCLRDRTEEIIIAHKSTPKLAAPKVPEDWITSEQFTEYTQDLWKVVPESAKRVGHPAPFPKELVERLIRLYAYPGATILDPFAGSGTTGMVASQLGCPSILFEVSPQYCQLIQDRANSESLPITLKNALDIPTASE